MDSEEYQPEFPNKYAEATTLKVKFNVEPEDQHGEKSKVVVLLNMADEMEDDLEDEVMEEAQKYGVVQDLVVHQDESNHKVQIYIKFLTLQAAEKCVKVMSGRFYSGKEIKPKFYSESSFNENVLGELSY